MAGKRDRAPGEGYLVVWSGSMSVAERDTQTALRAAGVRVEPIPATELSERVSQRAPDLVVLGQRGDERAKLVDVLAAVHPYVPIVALTAKEDARPQPRARFGLVARLDRDLPSPELAEALQELLDGFSRRLPRWRVQADLDDVPQVARRAAMAGRSGLLSASGAGAVALDSDGRIGPDPKLFVASLVGIPELDLTLYERPPESVRVFREPPEDAHRDLSKARVLLVDPDPSRFAELAAGFAEFEGVKVVSCRPNELTLQRALDPMAVVVSSETLLEPDCAPLWEDARYVPSGLLVLEGRALETTVEGLASFVASYVEPERALIDALRTKQPVAARLETLGTARWLKVLGQCQHDVTLRVFSAAGRARVDLSEGKIQGASFHLVGRDDVEGRAAVEMLLRLPFGRVLAGPPASLARFDGMRRTRKPSIVGRIVPMEVRGGKIMGEVVVQHTDTTVPLLRVPRPTLAEDDDTGFEEEEEESTRTYSADAMSQLRAELSEEQAEEASDQPSPDAADAEPDTPSAADEPAAPASEPAPKREASEAPAEATPKKKSKKKKSGAAGTKKSTAKKSGTKKSAVKKSAAKKSAAKKAAAKESEPGSPDAPAMAATSAGAPKKKTAAKATPARPSVDTVEDREASGSPMLWVAALVAIALGGYGVYRFSQNDAASSVAAGPESASSTPAAGSPGATAPPPPSEPPSAPTTPTQVVADPPRARPAPVAESPPESSVEPSAIPPVEGEDPPETPAVDEPVEEPIEEPAEVPVAEPPAAADEAEPLPPVPTTSAEITERIQASAAAARVRDYARSEALARLVIEASPRNARAAYRIAVAAFRQRHFDEALEWASNAETWNPADPLPVSLRGDIHMRRGNFNRAAVAYREALAIEPRFGPARRQLDRLQARGIGVD